MGIGDYLWPFERKFSKIPCAREAAIGGLVAGPVAGAVTFMVTSRVPLSYKMVIYGGLAGFWITFLSCRSQLAYARKRTQRYRDAVARGEID